MDFDYQKIKDEESRQREERLGSHPILQPRPNSRKPPVKPRRSIKCRPITQPGAGQSHSQANQKENEEVKRIAPSQVLSPAGPLEAQTPSLQAHNLQWFQIKQLPRLPNSVPCWLHIFATRREAEQLLQEQQQGCFLLRLSESKVGFVLSYRGVDKCRHFIIEEEGDMSGMEGQYVIAGENSRHHSLEELINYYTHNPVGPFSETLTVPCVQPNGSCEDEAKLEVRNEVEKGEEREEKTAATLPSSVEYPATGPVIQAASESAQYAVVRKALRKTRSLSECVSVPDTVPLIQGNTDSGTKTKNGIPEPVFGHASTCARGDVAHPADAPYARVNKPPRATPPSSINDTDGGIWGATAAPDSQSFPSAAVVAEQKYWELEPLHTYEETVHTRTCGDLPGHHLYSEVNIKGTRDDPMPASPPIRAGATFNSSPSSTRPIPRLPFRQPLRSAHAPVRPERSAQNFGGSPMMFPPPHSDPYQSEQLLPGNSAFPIYEQIPERPTKSRPPLPPPKPKH